MTEKEHKILFDEVGLVPGSDFKKGQWREIASHTEKEIRGFFGDYRFLSNFWPARVFLDGVEYSCVENAYQAAKFGTADRKFFLTCTPYEAVKYVRANWKEDVSWHSRKIRVMYDLLNHKFDRNINPELYTKLQSTGNKYLEETNWWGDGFWGVHRNSVYEEGIGENHLGTLLQLVRIKSWV